MKVTPEEIAAMKAASVAREDQWRAGMIAKAQFTRGGYVLTGDPTKERVGYVLAPDEESPRCAVCGMTICADAGWLPDLCPLTEDGRHVYANGEKAFRSPAQRAVAELIGEDPWD